MESSESEAVAAYNASEDRPASTQVRRLWCRVHGGEAGPCEDPLRGLLRDVEAAVGAAPASRL